MSDKMNLSPLQVKPLLQFIYIDQLKTWKRAIMEAIMV